MHEPYRSGSIVTINFRGKQGCALLLDWRAFDTNYKIVYLYDIGEPGLRAYIIQSINLLYYGHIEGYYDLK